MVTRLYNNPRPVVKFPKDKRLESLNAEVAKGAEEGLNSGSGTVAIKATFFIAEVAKGAEGNRICNLVRNLQLTL